MIPEINIKRIYQKYLKSDGCRILIDRLWPRGLQKKLVYIDDWEKELAPSSGLRIWFSHDPKKWEEFQHRYLYELQKNKVIDEFIEKHKKMERITLLYAGKDEEHTHAIVLKSFIEHLLKKEENN